MYCNGGSEFIYCEPIIGGIIHSPFDRKEIPQVNDGSRRILISDTTPD